MRYLVLMIHSFDRLRWTFGISGQLSMRLLMLTLLNQRPFFPMFGNGQMRLQPVYVEDVGQAIAKILQREQTGPNIFECGGPRVYSYQKLLRVVANAAGIKPVLFPVPFAAWS